MRSGIFSINSEDVSLGSSLGKRSENQDCVLFYRIRFRDTRKKNLLGLVLCDGMGGMIDGGKCSILAISSFLSSLASSDLINLKEKLNLAVHDANDIVFEEYNGKGGTTLSSVVIDDSNCLIANVGDSRVYRLLNDNTVEQLTLDDTLERKLGDLNIPAPPREFMQLLQFIGMGKELTFPVISVDLDTKTKYFVLTSDGAHNCGSPDNFKKILANSSSRQDVVSRLVTLSEWLGGDDNATVGVMTPETYLLWNQDSLPNLGSLEIWGISGKVEFFAINTTNHDEAKPRKLDKTNELLERKEKDLAQPIIIKSETKKTGRQKQVSQPSQKIGGEKKRKLDDEAVPVVDIKFSNDEDIEW